MAPDAARGQLGSALRTRLRRADSRQRRSTARAELARSLVQEVPLAGEHHGEAELVGLGDGVVVLHRAAGLDDHGHAGRRRRPRCRRGTGRRRRWRRRRPAARPAAFAAAIWPASTRFCWPAPMPHAVPSFTSTIELLFTQPTSRQASSASAHSASVGWRLVTTVQSSRVGREVVRRPARASQPVSWRIWWASGVGAERGRAGGCSCASWRAPRSRRRRSRARSRGRPGRPPPCARRWRRRPGASRATMPPKAERSSHSKARWYASARCRPPPRRTGWRA